MIGKHKKDTFVYFFMIQKVEFIHVFTYFIYRKNTLMAKEFCTAPSSDEFLADSEHHMMGHKKNLN